MVLNNLTLLDCREPENISFKGMHIASVTRKATSLIVDNFQVNFENAIAFPGLVNSHDHLEFNCFSRFGDRVYNNYTEWGEHIQKDYKKEINHVLKIPVHLRTMWGIYKNLLAGITTVVNHGSKLEILDPLITVKQEYQCLHSVKFQKGWIWKLNNPFLRNELCVIHTGEGTDLQSYTEIDKLIRWNLLNRKLIGVHGVAMTAEQARHFTGVVWCPESNQILLNKSADVDKWKNVTQVVIGTDSTLSGDWNIWNHLRLARKSGQVSDAELFEMVTKSPSKLWHINNGRLSTGRRADITIVKNKSGQATGGWNDFYSTDPEDILMVIHKGFIRLFDASLTAQLKKMNFNMSEFTHVSINGCGKFVEGNLPGLMNEIKNYYPETTFPCAAAGTKKQTTDA
jgi:cytosine/adenosine deaminase-related metal-dependent hydrolase